MAAKMSTPEMAKARSTWEKAWGAEDSQESHPSTGDTESSPKTLRIEASPSLDFSTEEIHEFVEEFDRMAAEALDVDPHPTFAKFLGRLSVPAARKYASQLENAPEKIAILAWGAYLTLLYFEWRGKELKEAADEVESGEGGTVEKRAEF